MNFTKTAQFCPRCTIDWVWNAFRINLPPRKFWKNSPSILNVLAFQCKWSHVKIPPIGWVFNKNVKCAQFCPTYTIDWVWNEFRVSLPPRKFWKNSPSILNLLAFQCKWSYVKIHPIGWVFNKTVKCVKLVEKSNK